jgi:hypothetical protein
VLDAAKVTPAGAMKGADPIRLKASSMTADGRRYEIATT